MPFLQFSRLSSIDRPFTERISALLIPRLFLTSLVVGFVLSALLGYLSTKKPLFQDFVRIHQLIGSESLFNVTALQARRLVEDVPRNKILVIIGGDSRLNGVGQTPPGIWSKRLQARLGSDYRVINLALRSGAPNLFGSFVAEAMIKEGRKVIFVADTPLLVPMAPLGPTRDYRYMFYDAKARDLLLQSSARDAQVKVQEDKAITGWDLQELYLRASLNRFAYFDDLWNYVGYWYLFIGGWSQLALPSPTEARVFKKDPEQTVPANGYYDYYIFEKSLAQLRTAFQTINKEHYLAYEQSLETIPRPLRIHAIWFPICYSPYYTTHFTDEEKSVYAASFTAANEAHRRVGFVSVVVGCEWSVNDFADAQHLTEQGAQKLVEIVAPLVAEKARTLGYGGPP